LDTISALKAIQDLTDGVKDIATQLKDIQDNDSLNIEQYKDVKIEVVRVIRDIAQTNGDLAKKVRKINLIRAEMKETRETIKQLKNDVEASKAYIVRFTEFLYRLNNEFYDQNYDLDEIKLFIKSDSIAGTLSNETLIQSLIARLNELITAMRQQQQEELSLLKKLNALELDSREDIRSYKTQLENLTQKKRYLQAFLILYKMDASRFKGELKDLFETRKDIQNTVVKIAGDRAAGSYTTPQYDTIALKQTLESLTQYGNPSQTPFSWPLLPINTL
jgi:chromosome segregation ATPase